MITLLTGQPGNGKTSWIINRIKEELAKGRIVYTVNIPMLDLAVIPLTKRQLSAWSLTDPVYDEYGNLIAYDDIDWNDPEQKPKLSNIVEGSIIFVDEAQKQGFNPTGTAIPKHVANLDEHRHFGLDFVFITQYPALVHQVVKALVSKHYHIRFTWAGRKIYEWPEWQEQPKSKQAIEDANAKRYKIDPTTFKHYHSSSKHINMVHNVPLKAWLLLILFLALPYLLYKSYERVTAKATGQIDANVSADQFDVIPHANAQEVKQLTSNSNHTVMYALPAQYDWNQVGGCVTMKDGCKCFDLHGVKLLIPQPVCEQAITEGWLQDQSVYDASHAEQTRQRL